MPVPLSERKKPSLKAEPCKACRGYGRSTSNRPCEPCAGTGVQGKGKVTK